MSEAVMPWVSRFTRQWLLVCALMLGALFFVGDSQGWLEALTGKDLSQSWLFLAALLAVCAAFMLRLVSLESHVEDRKRHLIALKKVDTYLFSGDQLLNQWGGPDEVYYLIPMAYLEQGLPNLGKWNRETQHFIEQELPEYLGKFLANGNLTLGTAQKKAAIQQLEARLRALSEIQDDLRSKL